ncbi:TPA: hypothetical protein JLV93_003151 [Escherichia coli]|nr:hypothetical protein [Escherichia coli]MCS1252202.1 hypothetical protein [Escherichia coli]MCS1278668.1 hypothetical protein [Escherichia coli]HBB9769170.1 hypothetical protein [Escherichia coli]HBB9871644.1 hypothetical protein [Escherichia coli]
MSIKHVVISALRNRFYTGKDKVTFDYVLAAKLRDAGLAIERNYPVDLGNCKRGFVDIMVTAPSGEQCAIEVDKASPRARSILKLRRLKQYGIPGVVVLRCSRTPNQYITDEIDVIPATGKLRSKGAVC